jgi:hypothetical protein
VRAPSPKRATIVEQMGENSWKPQRVCQGGKNGRIMPHESCPGAKGIPRLSRMPGCGSARSLRKLVAAHRVVRRSM